MASASSIEPRALETIDLHQATEGLPAQQVLGTAAIDAHWGAPSPVMPAPLKPRHFFGSHATVAAIAAIGVLGIGVLTWSHFARSAQSERTRTNIETAAKLTRISEEIQITSREDYEAARALRQWAVDLDRHNAEALANLSFAMVTGVLNHWSVDEVADLFGLEGATDPDIYERLVGTNPEAVFDRQPQVRASA